jgi:FixJ family two-component response regulator
MSEAQPVVVIIDDDPDIRDALQGLVETVGLQAAPFATAPEFLSSKRPEGPCCIVLDVRLPGLSGLDFQQELARENIPIPIIFITGHGDIPMSVRAMKAGAVEFLMRYRRLCAAIAPGWRTNARLPIFGCVANR